MTRFGSLITLAFSLFAGNALAAAADGAAQAKIDEAINVHYLDTNFAKAEKTLNAAIAGCASKCSPTIVGRAWMYIGIIRAVGNQDTSGASVAFASAVEADPNVKLDTDLATPETKQLFEAAKAGGGGGGDETGEDAEEESSEDSGGSSGAGPAASVTGNMECSPTVSEVETRRPIPVACTADDSVKRAVLHYKAPGSSRFVPITLGLSDGQWMGTIPCAVTNSSGTLSWYVVGSGSAGEPVDGFSSKDEPTEISIVESSAEAPPSYPDKDPPNRCMDVADCPEEMRGTPSCPGTEAPGGSGAWGASCKKQAECSADLACISGTCETPSACETDAECNGGTCQNAVCAYSDDGSSSGGGAHNNWLGVHFGFDLAQVGGKSICDPNRNREFSCYYTEAGKQVPYRLGAVPPNQAATLNSTFAPATMRIMASFEHLFTSNIGGEARVGMGFGTLSPATQKNIIYMLHAELRAKYWFSGTGEGLRPYLTVGGGMGQVDTALQVKLLETPTGGGTGYEVTPAGTFCTDPTSCIMSATAYKSYGSWFVGGGGGLMYNFGPVGINLELLARVMLPVSTLVLTPNVGFQIGL